MKMKDKTTKPDWFKEGVKSDHVGCVCCEGNQQLLPLDTVLYHGFGGWYVRKNSEMFFQELDDTKGFDQFKTIKDIEEMIGDDTENCYEAVLFAPLREGVWQRHEKNKWILIDEGMGFA